MSTILFNEIVFGPIHSRRLGSSLGVNLLPRYGKWCNFDCLYCECGFNADGKGDKSLPKAADVRAALEDKLSTIHKEGGNIDTITFSGNGEPTMHPDFPAIIDYALELRNKFFPNAKVSVLSNASRIGVPEVADALLKVDNAILKIDSAFEETTMQIDRPQFHYSLENLKKGLNPFRGKSFYRQCSCEVSITEQLLTTQQRGRYLHGRSLQRRLSQERLWFIPLTERRLPAIWRRYQLLRWRSSLPLWLKRDIRFL